MKECTCSDPEFFVQTGHDASGPYHYNKCRRCGGVDSDVDDEDSRVRPSDVDAIGDRDDDDD